MDPRPLLVIGFEECGAEAVMFALKTCQRDHHDAGRSHQVVDEALIGLDTLRHSLNRLFDFQILDGEGLAVVEEPLLEHDRVVEGAPGFVEDDVLTIREHVAHLVGPLGELLCPRVQMFGITWVSHDTRDRHLGECRGRYFQAFCGEEGVHVASEVAVLALVEDLQPTTTRTGPREFLADSPHRDTGHVSDPFAHAQAARAIVDDVRVDLVRDQKHIVFVGDCGDCFHDLARVDRSGGVVRREH